MKSYLYLILIPLLSTAIILTCKKDDTPKDYTESIKGKTLWGSLISAGETTQYCSVHFNTDNSFVWSQLLEHYRGSWAVDKNKLTLNFTNPPVILTAEISDGNKLMKITTYTINKVNNGELIVKPTIALDNVSGKRLLQFPPGTIAFQLSFMQGATSTLQKEFSFLRPAPAQIKLRR